MNPVPSLESVARMSGEQAREARARTRACACTHPCHLSDSLAYDADFLVRFVEA